jgi:K+-transporting ATPase KdpF subunit
VSVETAIGAVIAVALLGYLVYTLLLPDRF